MSIVPLKKLLDLHPEMRTPENLAIVEKEKEIWDRLEREKEAAKSKKPAQRQPVALTQTKIRVMVGGLLVLCVVSLIGELSLRALFAAAGAWACGVYLWNPAAVGSVGVVLRARVADFRGCIAKLKVRLTPVARGTKKFMEAFLLSAWCIFILYAIVSCPAREREAKEEYDRRSKERLDAEFKRIDRTRY